MSRTFVHRPPWVQERDPALRRGMVVQHDHWQRDQWDPATKRWLVRRSVSCDLELYLSGKGQARTRCRVTWWAGRNIYCGCRVCTGHHGRRAARRRERAAGQAECRRSRWD